MQINGATRVLGIVGHPIQQVRAPAIWTGLFRRNGINAICIPFHVMPADLDRFIEGASALRNLAGVIVTVPHKAMALKHVQAPTERARLVQAVNMIRWREDGTATGDIVDGIGFVRGLEAKDKPVAGKSALVVGSGGAGTAIAFALAEAGAAEIAVSDIDPQRAERLASRLREIGTTARVSPAVAHSFDLAVNASPTGMRAEDPLPINLENVSAATIVADAIMHPPVTLLLEQATQRGCFIQPGATMMDYQLAEMAKFFGFDGDYSPKAIEAVAGPDNH
ncbi:shikimate 5-dehydrogenase [Caballeronia temeraria]|uniref:Shikimate 5-dehydrogenase n=1 Tax=Caballeronia temeraria TaxID=1777137 RepID=A0A158DMC7_9BURK|nr:shikimate dehydrogenase [Caballeronia temeraria]SAK95346.1 shikimate 5-dehydrogenase [Caballeronia temeraria]